MKVGILGSGAVGRTLASRLRELGHDVHVGTRSEGTYPQAADAGEVIVNATAAHASIEALEAAGERSLTGKVLIDLANPLADAAPPSAQGLESLGERLQARFPAARVVKTLNTVNAEVMVRPEIVPGEHVLFVCGDDEGAKRTARELLSGFGWPSERVVDLGGIRAARATEGYLSLWLELMRDVGHARFNISLEVGS